ncbi:hypothetical protein HMF3257_03675 [Spirosoma telluris]|uniref:Uncharacterized protein n=1 Tax=Spirosoma telluris TaxID=2183553 RepID=A0A327NEV8_9BACT|nr:hypothetical protein HMF3257_03675 [Spirosoma telluris]
MEKAENEIIEKAKASGEKGPLGDPFIDKAISNLIFRDNYIVFSLTKLSINNYSNVIGVGASGNVFLFKHYNALKLYNF